jgi:uncharacterized protein
MDIFGAMAIGVAAGMLGGMTGLGGGVLFIPGLVFFLGLSQLSAESTSLLAIVPVAIVGAWRQNRYGNVRLRDGMTVAALSPVGVVIGVTLANTVSQRALEIGFASVQLVFAFGLARRALRYKAGDG